MCTHIHSVYPTLVGLKLFHIVDLILKWRSAPRQPLFYPPISIPYLPCGNYVWKKVLVGQCWGDEVKATCGNWRTAGLYHVPIYGLKAPLHPPGSTATISEEKSPVKCGAVHHESDAYLLNLSCRHCGHNVESLLAKYSRQEWKMSCCYTDLGENDLCCPRLCDNVGCSSYNAGL